jgi:hypothetical protein
VTAYHLLLSFQLVGARFCAGGAVAAAGYSHLEDKRLAQLYWKTRFAEYILDQLWTALQKANP